MTNTEDLLVCTACSTQYDTSNRAVLKSCRTCDDPRQFVPRDGQSFTTLGELRSSKKYRNEITKIDETDDRFWSVRTEPPFGIGQRAFFIITPFGNVLWDCVAYFDDDTVKWIKEMGGLDAVVISHPHYYSTHVEWAQTFDCPIYLANEDKVWLNRFDETHQVFLHSTAEELILHGKGTGIQILKVGGHFPGSLVLLAYDRLLIADTLVITPSGLGDWSVVPDPMLPQTSALSSTIPYPATLPDSEYPHTSASRTVKHPIGQRPPGMITFVFMWSIPNMIPLTPDEVMGLWEVLKDYNFTSAHGAFKGLDLYDGAKGSARSVKGRVLDSMQIQIRRMGWEGHDFLKRKLEDDTQQ